MPLLTPHVPIGLIELMKDLAKEVLRDKPENICEYAVAHFEKLILARDGCMDKGYERFTAYEAHFEGQQRFAVPSSYGYICQKAIKAKAVPQPRKSKSDVMANFQAMESINEEDAPSTAPENTAPKPANNNIGQSDYDEEKYQNAIYVIQRYFRRHVARKRKISSNGSSGETLSEVSAAIIIQRTMRRLFSNKIKLKKETTMAASSAVKLVHDDVDNVSEAASYTSSSTIQMLADGQEGRENRLATAQSPSPRQEEEERQQQREELSDSDGYADGDGNIEVNGKGVGDGVAAGATADLTSLEFKEPPKDEQEKPTSSSSPTEAVVVADDVTDEKKHSPSVEAVAANSAESVETEVDRKSIADENGNPVTVAEENSTHPPPPSASSANDDTSTAQNFGILSTQIGSNYNHQNLSNTKTNIKIDTNARKAPPIQPNPINMTKQVGNIIPAGLSVPLNYPKSSSTSSSSLGATPETLPATSPHLEQTQETFMVHRLQEHDNGNENDIDKNIDGSSYFQGKIDDGRMRKFDSMTVDDAGESLKLFDGFQHQGNVLFDQEFSDSLNESTMEKDSLEPEELDVDSLESNENVVHHHMSEIVKKEDASQDDGSLYGDDNDGELDAENVQKFNEIERVPTYLYGIHPARTPIPERKAKNRNPEETRKVPDEQKNLEAVKSVDEIEKSEEDSTESKGSSSGESSATQIENNLQHRQEKDNQHGNYCKLSEDNKETKPEESVPQEPSSNQEVTDGSSLNSNQQEVVIIHQRDDDSTAKESQEAGKDNFSRETKTTEEVRSDASVPENLRARRETKMFIDSERGLLSKNKESTTFSKEETFIQREKVVSSSTTYHSEEIISKEESKAEKISTDHLVTSTKSVQKSSHEENKTILSNETLHRENKSTEARVNTEVAADLETSTKSVETSSHEENKTILSNQTLEDMHNRENKSNEERVNTEVAADLETSTKSLEKSSHEDNKTILSNKTPGDLKNRENKSNEERVNTEVVADLETSTKSVEASSHEDNNTILSNKTQEDLKNRENKSYQEHVNPEVVAAPREESKGLSITSDDQPDRILDDHDQEVLLQFQELQSLNDDEVTRTNLDDTQNEDTSIHKILEQNDLQVGDSTAAEQTQHQIKNLESPKNLTSEKNSSLRGNVSEISEESQVSLTEKEDRLMNKEGIIQVHDHSHETEEQINGLKTVDLNRILKTTTLEEGKDVGIRVRRESDSHKTLTSQSSAVEEEQRAISDTNISKPQSEKLPGNNESSGAKKTYEFGDLNRQGHDDKPSTRTTNSDPINEIETRKKELQDLSEADKVVKESKDEILEKDSGLEDLDTLDEKVPIKEDSSSPDFLGSTVEKDRLQDNSQIIDDQENLELKSSPEPKEDQREIKSLEKGNPKPFAEAIGTQNMSKEKERNEQHLNDDSDKAPHSEVRDQDEENNKITENNFAESEILKKEDVDKHEEKKVSEGIETAKGSEEVKVNGTQLPIISNDKETPEEEPVSANNDSLSTEEPLKKIDQENLDQSSSPENVGYAESSAETSADFSSIGKDLDFFEDTIKYLKNATQHLGEMDDVFDTKESSGQKSIRDSELLKHSAVLIQSAFRGYQVRRDLKELNELEKKTEDEKAKEDNAAIKIQSAYRGHRVRRSIKDQVVEDNTGVVTSLAKEEFPSPSRDILATNAARSQIPVAVIHPTKYPSSEEESPKKKLTPPSQRSRSVTNYHPSTSSGKKTNTRSSPSKTVTTLRRQKPVEKRPTITKKSTIDESSIEKRLSNDSLDQTVQIDKTTLVLNRKLPTNGNKSKNLRTKTQSANDILEKIGSTSVKDQFKAKGKSLSTNGNRAQSRDSFDLEAIKKELLSNTAKSPPQAGKKKKPKSGKRSSPKKQPKGSRIPQKSPKTILTNKQAQPLSGNEDHETSNETNLSKTFIKETEETVSEPNEEEPGYPKKTLNKTYTVRSSLNEIEGLDSSLSARHENASEDLFDSLKKDVDKLKAEVQEKSAVTIQKTFRGYKTRKFLKTKGSGENLSERTIKSSRGSPVSLETIVEMPLEKENEIESSSKELLTTNDDQQILEEASIQQSNTAIDEKKHEKQQVNVISKSIEGESNKLGDNKPAVEGEKVISITVNTVEKTAEGKKEKSAIVIQKTFRGYQSRKQLKSKKDDVNFSVNKEENPPNPTKKLVEDGSGVFKTLQKDFEDYKSCALNKSATTIQKHFRGFRTRKMLNTQTVLNPIEKEKGLTKDVEEELSKGIDESTVKTEKRANINEKGIEESPRKENKDRDKYATTIQKNYRGYRTRKQLQSGPKNKELTKTESLTRETEPLQKPGDCDRFNVEEFHKEALEKSATTIQRSFRGYQTRKRLQSKELPVVPEESVEGKDKIEELREDLREDKKSSVNDIANSKKLGEDLQNVVVADHTSNMLTENKVSNDSLEKAECPDQDNREIRLEQITEETNLSEGTIDAELARDKEPNEKANGIVKHSESKDHVSQKSNHSLSAGAVLENAASTIQKAFRDYQSKKINHPTKSYSNGFQRGTTTPKEILENSDESSTFIGPDTSFDLSDVDSVETRSEKTLNYDKVSSSETHTPVNSGEEGDRALSLRDLEIESETTPQKLRLKRSLIEPTAPPLDEILPAEDPTEVMAASPKLKWFVGEEPIVPSDSSAAESSVIPLISSTDSTSNIDDLSSFDACFDTNSNSNQQLMPSVSKTNNSAVVSTSSLLLTNNTEINDKNSLYTTSEIVSANEEEKKDFKKEEGNLENEKGDEEKVVKLEEEEDIQAKTLMKSGCEGPEEDRQVDAYKEVPTDLCKNCAEGKHERGAVCSGDLINSQKNVRTDSEQSDQIKQFVLMEEGKTGPKTEPAISSGKEEANIENHLPANAGVNSSADCPVISLIPPSSEDTDTSEQDASLQDSIKTQDPIIKESEQVKSEGLEESKNQGSDTIKSEATVTVTDEDLATKATHSLHSKEGSFSKEEKLFPKEVGLTDKLSSEGQDPADQPSVSKQSSNKNDSLEDPFKTRPGEELSAQEKGFEDDFSDISDSKDLEEASAVEIPSSEAKSQANQVPKETAGSVVRSEESEDTANHEDLIEKFVKLEEKSIEELKKSDSVTLDKEVTLQEKVEGSEVVQNVNEHTAIEGSGEKMEDLNDDRKEELTAEKTDKIDDPKPTSVDEEKLGKEGSSSTNDEGPAKPSDADSQLTNEDQEEKEKEQARKLQEDMEIAAKLIEIGLSDPLAKILEKESKLAASEEPSVKDDESSGATNDQPDSPTQAKLEQLIEDHSKAPEDPSNTVDPKDLPTKNASEEVDEVPCVKKVISPPPDSPDESELESTTTKADSSPTTPGYDETSETDAPDASKSDNLLAMAEKLREPEEMVARMQQRRASEQRVSLESVTDPQVAFEEPICEPIKPMEKIQKSSSTDVEDDLVLQKLQRGDTTRESSAQSESVVFGDTTSQSQITESEDTFNENLGLHSLHRMNTINESRGNFKPPSHLFKSVTIDDTVKYIDPEKSTEESGSSFCMDDALSEDVRKKMMAYSVSEADSDYYDVGDHQTGRPHDDFNISTALDTFPSTDTDTTIISAATKIQAGARGFLTRRRIRRASMGTKASLTEDKNVSFGNAAIGESLDQLAEEDAGRRQFNRTTGVNSLPSALEHSDEILSPRVDGTQIAVKSSEHLIKIENVSSASSTENDVNLGLQQPFSEDDSFQMATSLEATVARRLTLQRGDALRNDSTPDDENGNGKQVDFAKNTSSMTVHEKTTTTTTTTMTKTTTERRNYSDAAVTSKKDTIKWFALRQNSMPVQIDSEVFRVLPKHMRKRIKSAEGEKPKRIRLPRD